MELFGLNPILIGIFALSVGSLTGYYLRQVLAVKRIASAEAKAINIINEAKSKAQNLLLKYQKLLKRKR